MFNGDLFRTVVRLRGNDEEDVFYLKFTKKGRLKVSDDLYRNQ